MILGEKKNLLHIKTHSLSDQQVAIGELLGSSFREKCYLVQFSWSFIILVKKLIKKIQTFLKPLFLETLLSKLFFDDFVDRLYKSYAHNWLF